MRHIKFVLIIGLFLISPFNAFALRSSIHGDPIVVITPNSCPTETNEGPKVCKSDKVCDCVNNNSDSLGLMPASGKCEDAPGAAACIAAGGEVSSSPVNDPCLESHRQVISKYNDERCPRGTTFNGDVSTPSQTDGDCCSDSVSYQCCPNE